jgi:hypothetical protein
VERRTRRCCFRAARHGDDARLVRDLGALVIVMNGAPIMPNPPTMYHGLARIPDEGFGLLLAPWQRWDAIWFLQIAQFGYAPNDASPSFFACFRY